MTQSPTQHTDPQDAQQDVSTVAFVSLGCPKNLVDSEKMLGLLAESGMIPVADEEDADAIVINTCGFLEASKEESIGEIQRAVELKHQGACKRVVVAGCLVQRHRAKMLEWCPEIDAMIGVFDRDRILEAVTGTRTDRSDLNSPVPVYSSIAANATMAWQQRHETSPDQSQQSIALTVKGQGYFEDDTSRLRLTPRHYAFLRMSEGCNQNCAFCTIPSIRGKMRSKPVDRIIAEMQELIRDGAFELSLIGQDTTSYGEDIGYEPGLAGLLRELDKAAADATGGALPGAWIRLMYAYPSAFTDEMIDAIAALPRILKYIDMPLQHINDRVLDSMRRRTSRKLIETLLGKLRDRVPGIAIRTTFISGFPGETEEEHKELVQFVRDFGFDAIGVFPYSPEPGTPAGRMHAEGNAVPDDVIDARIEELMLAQQEVVFNRNQQMVDEARAFDVLIDAPSETEFEASGEGSEGLQNTSIFEGRTYQQAPDIDSTTLVISREELSPGEVVPCRIVGFNDYDLIAQPVADLERKVSLPMAGH